MTLGAGLYQPPGIDTIDRSIVNIRITVDARLQSQRIFAYEAAPDRIIVPRPVGIQAGAIILAASEAEGVRIVPSSRLQMLPDYVHVHIAHGALFA